MTRADPIRAALERLIEALDDYEPTWGCFPESALADARAALDEQQGEGPNDKELNTLWNCSGIADEHGNHTGNIFEFARAVLARWGHQPAPPAEGEVGELVKYLRGVKSLHCQRAAELLQQQHPTPVPVSERLPEPEDCDAEGRCWQWTPFEEGTNFPAPGDWGLQLGEWLSNVRCQTTHWLPAHALPLPQGEVEA